MNETIITGPHCSGEISLNEALTSQLHARFNDEYAAKTRQAVRKAEEEAAEQLAAISAALQQKVEEQANKAREAQAAALALQEKAMSLEAERAQAIEKARIETEERLRKETEARMREQLERAEKNAPDAAALQLQQLEQHLAEERTRLTAAQKAELELRKKVEAAEIREREIELELTRRIDDKKTEWEAGLRQSLSVEQDLKLKEKDKKIEDMKKVIDELKRKSEQGSQEMQGEVLEIDIQAALEHQFPHDVIRPVPKGMTGADLIQDVRDTSMNVCGSLIWEVKNTSKWQNAWLDKLKGDQREAGAAIPILVSATLPSGVRGFARVQGVWVVDLVHYPMLATALRDQLLQVAFVRAASQGKNEKMEMVYQYLAGDEFRHRVEAIVEAFSAMRAQLEKERRAISRLWAEREKQIERGLVGTTGMYGSLQGIIGQSMPAIAALELDAAALLEGGQ